MNPKKTPQIVVIGGGISGLACATRLFQYERERNFPIHLRLLESAPNPGGVISTLHREDCLIEEGPDAIFTEKPWGLDFLKRLGLESKIIGTNPHLRKSFVFIEGKLRPVPEGFYLVGPSKIWPFITTSVFTWPGKLRALCDLWISKRESSGDESLASFVRRRLGQEILERMAQPMVAGIYSSDPEDLSLEATFPQFLEMEKKHGSLIKAFTQRNSGVGSLKAATGPRYSLFVSLKDGLGSLVKRIQEKLPPGMIQCGKKVNEIHLQEFPKKRFHIRGNNFEMEADCVCVALPAPKSAGILRSVDSGLSESLSRIPYHSGATINLGYEQSDLPHPLKGFGFVVPEIEKRWMTGCTFSSVKFPGRSPQGREILRAFVGGEKFKDFVDLPDPEILSRVQSDLKDILGISANPLFSHVSRYPDSLPQYRVGHQNLVQAIEGQVREIPGLALAGNAYRGVGIPDCIRSGEKAADQIFKTCLERVF